jgi:hypothetical protein
MDAFTKQLIAAGHATTDKPEFSEPQTLAGDYKATNGFWYYCGWSNGKNFVRKVGYSSEYNNALREAEEKYGAWGEDNHAQILGALSKQLKLALV